MMPIIPFCVEEPRRRQAASVFMRGCDEPIHAFLRTPAERQTATLGSLTSRRNNSVRKLLQSAALSALVLAGWLQYIGHGCRLAQGQTGISR
jgi:hypothetical protein